MPRGSGGQGKSTLLPASARSHRAVRCTGVGGPGTGTDSLTGTRPARFAMEVAESSVALSHVLDDRLHEDRQRAPPRSRLSRPGLVVGVLLSAFKLRLIGGQPEPIDLDHLTCW